jgi:hypothetical protein
MSRPTGFMMTMSTGARRSARLARSPLMMPTYSEGQRSRTALTTSHPLSPGILRSVRTRSTDSSVSSWAMPSSPLEASITVCPREPSKRACTSRTTSSSSMTRILISRLRGALNSSSESGHPARHFKLDARMRCFEAQALAARPRRIDNDGWHGSDNNL